MKPINAMPPSRLLKGALVMMLGFSGLFAWRWAAAADPADSGTGIASLAGAGESVPPASAAAAPQSQPASAPAAESHSIFRAEPLEALARSLREKQSELERREKAVKEAEARLESLRREVEQNLARIEQTHQAMQRIASQADLKRKTEIKKWVKIYEAMNPEQAGKVIEGLAPELAMEIMSEMEPKKAGKILGFVGQQRAVQLGEALKNKDQ